MRNLRYSKLTRVSFSLILLTVCVLGYLCFENSDFTKDLLKLSSGLIVCVLIYNLANARFHFPHLYKGRNESDTTRRSQRTLFTQ